MTKVAKALSSSELSTFQIVHLGECWWSKLFSFWYDMDISNFLAQFAWFCKSANNSWLLDSCPVNLALWLVKVESCLTNWPWAIWSKILNFIQWGIKNGTVTVSRCQASKLMLVFLVDKQSICWLVFLLASIQIIIKH